MTSPPSIRRVGIVARSTRTRQGAKDLVDDGLLADELAAPGAFADGAPDDVVMARLPKGGAVALGDLLEDGRDKLGVGRELGHGHGPLCDGLGLST